MMDQLLHMMEQSDLEGVRGVIGEEMTGKGRAWAIHLSLFPLVQRVLNPPFINPHLPKMYRIIREFLPYLKEDDIPPLVRLEINEYTRRPKSTGVARPPRPSDSASFSQIETAIREGADMIEFAVPHTLGEAGAVHPPMRRLIPLALALATVVAVPASRLTTRPACSGALHSFDAMPSRCAVRITAVGPNSKVSRTDTVLSDSASALVSGTGPKYSWV